MSDTRADEMTNAQMLIKALTDIRDNSHNLISLVLENDTLDIDKAFEFMRPIRFGVNNAQSYICTINREQQNSDIEIQKRIMLEKKKREREAKEAEEAALKPERFSFDD